MLTEGILTNIDYTTNRCWIQIPILETVGNDLPIILEGRFSIQPGIFDGFKINDPVWVEFADDKYNKPVVLGKIYKGSFDELQNNGGHANITNLQVTGNNVSIPKETQIKAAEFKYNTIEKLINHVREIEDKIPSMGSGNANIKVEGTTIYIKTK